MKNVTLIFFFSFSSLFVNAENCLRSGSFAGAGDVDVKGHVTLETLPSGDLQLKLSSDFVSDAGPDLDLYIGQTDRVNNSSIKIAALAAVTGEQTYLLPTGTALNDYDYISVHCTRYNHFFGAAFLGDQSGNCALLTAVEERIPPQLNKGIDNRIQQHININTGPSEVIITAAEDYFDVDMKILDLMGRLIYQQSIDHLVKGTLKVPVHQIPIAIVSLKGQGWRLNKKVFFNHK
jgi:hypothetical protein